MVFLLSNGQKKVHFQNWGKGNLNKNALVIETKVDHSLQGVSI